MTKRVFKLAHDIARQRAIEAVRTAPEGDVVTIAEASRTLDQNAAQWPILDAFSQSLVWPVNGRMATMTAEEWKDVLTAAFRKETARLAMGIDGGVVMLGAKTSAMGKREFGEWLEFLHAVAADRGVVLDVHNDRRDGAFDGAKE
jgi:NinB protein